jgi:arylsulfatase A-like enzyme
MIASVDESVGRVMKTLDELKLADNTVLIFTSDNGGVGGYEREGVQGGSITDNAPLKSGKGSLYEGGTREPFIVRWPGVTKAGTSCGVNTAHVDIYPTFLESRWRHATPANQVQDGESLVPLFKDCSANLKRTAIFQHFPGYLGAGANTWRTTPVATITSGDWKLMEFMEDKRLELYNLRDDIGERNNLAATNPGQGEGLAQTSCTPGRPRSRRRCPRRTRTSSRSIPRKGRAKEKARARARRRRRSDGSWLRPWPPAGAQAHR